jgi:hypothetical protein
MIFFACVGGVGVVAVSQPHTLIIFKTKPSINKKIIFFLKKFFSHLLLLKLKWAIIFSYEPNPNIFYKVLSHGHFTPLYCLCRRHY